MDAASATNAPISIVNSPKHVELSDAITTKMKTCFKYATSENPSLMRPSETYVAQRGFTKTTDDSRTYPLYQRCVRCNQEKFTDVKFQTLRGATKDSIEATPNWMWWAFNIHTHFCKGTECADAIFNVLKDCSTLEESSGLTNEKEFPYQLSKPIWYDLLNPPKTFLKPLTPENS